MGELVEGQTVIYEKFDAVGFVGLNRPDKLNAQNGRMVKELLAALKEAEVDPEVRVIVFHGKGRAFCSGHDLAEAKLPSSLEEHIADVEELQEITATIVKMGKPVIAAVHGYAIGAGCEWAMNCDLIIAAEGTKFGFPETTLGSAVSNGGTKILPLLIGLLRAKEMILANRIIDADLAGTWGLVNKVVPPDRLLSEATAMAQKIAQGSALANRLAKAAINQALHLDIGQTLRMELNDMVITSLTGEFTSRGASSPEKA
jgi:2-(1,2-epoxy-1,2-dihydrophenyl)acetyl-CoA isomerase